MEKIEIFFKGIKEYWDLYPITFKVLYTLVLIIGWICVLYPNYTKEIISKGWNFCKKYIIMFLQFCKKYLMVFIKYLLINIKKYHKNYKVNRFIKNNNRIFNSYIIFHGYDITGVSGGVKKMPIVFSFDIKNKEIIVGFRNCLISNKNGNRNSIKTNNFFPHFKINYNKYHEDKKIKEYFYDVIKRKIELNDVIDTFIEHDIHDINNDYLFKNRFIEKVDKNVEDISGIIIREYLHDKKEVFLKFDEQIKKL